VKIAIIGTGNVGQALGSSLVGAGHQVTFAARDAAKTHEVAASVGAAAADSPADAAAGADVIVLAVPYPAAEEVARELGTQAQGKIVVDVSNPLKPDLSGLATEGGPSAAERFATMLDGARVGKAFNTVFATVQGNPKAHGTPVDVFYATDDADARATLADLIGSLGFRPVYAGPLAAARELESLALLNIRLQAQSNGDWRSSYVLLGAPPAATGR
jgi:predicted dinucleotide-binding enzyme